VRWSVDRFFAELFASIDLSATAVLYTSDHGQVFASGKLTHCSIDFADPREGLVPMLAFTGAQELQQRFARGAELNYAKASHFEIVPTVLELMGYPDATVHADQRRTLFDRLDERSSFTSGDIFGLFSSRVRWHPIDLRANYLEPEARPRPAVSIGRSLPAPGRSID
jgi:arylsulfatase A-like enzyme